MIVYLSVSGNVLQFLRRQGLFLLFSVYRELNSITGMCAHSSFYWEYDWMSYLPSGSFWLLQLPWLTVTSPRLVPTPEDCISLVCGTLRFQLPFALSQSLSSNSSLAFRSNHKWGDIYSDISLRQKRNRFQGTSLFFLTLSFIPRTGELFP